MLLHDRVVAAGDPQLTLAQQDVLLTVPAGTRSGRKLRLRGRGMSNGRGGHGDLYAVVHIDVPAALTDRERELFKEMAAASRFDPRAVAAGEAS
mgnify:CR=1 FL=1